MARLRLLAAGPRSGMMAALVARTVEVMRNPAVRVMRSRPVPKLTVPRPCFVEVAHGGRSFRIAVKRVSQARRLTLKVRAATLDAVLTMPARGSMRAARDFAERHAQWVGDRLDRLPCRVPFEVGSTVPLRGVNAAIVGRPSLRAAAWIEGGEGPRPLICVSGSTPGQQRARVLDLLRREARRDFEAAVDRHAAAVGRRVAGVSLRDTRSRWGSCTARGALNFSWRLVMAPPFVLDYLAAHEVAHLIHMDHSPAYWAVAGRLAPDLAAAEAWLKANGAGLHRFG